MLLLLLSLPQHPLGQQEVSGCDVIVLVGLQSPVMEEREIKLRSKMHKNYTHVCNQQIDQHLILTVSEKGSDRSGDLTD